MINLNRAGGAVIVGAVLAVLTFPGTASAGADKDCSDFDYREEAQEYFDEQGYSADNDPERLDSTNGRGDGVACESLPRRPKSERDEDDEDSRDDDKDDGRDSDDEKDSRDEDEDGATAPAGSQTRVWPRGAAEAGGR